MKHGLVTLVVIMVLKDTSTFQVLSIVSFFCVGTSLLWRSTVAFTYLKVKSTKYLLPVVLVLVKAIKYSKTSWETQAVAIFILRTVSPPGGAGSSVILASVATVQCNEKFVHC